jgi:hypothetical protein
VALRAPRAIEAPVWRCISAPFLVKSATNCHAVVNWRIRGCTGELARQGRGAESNGTKLARARICVRPENFLRDIPTVESLAFSGNSMCPGAVWLVSPWHSGGRDAAPQAPSTQLQYAIARQASARPCFFDAGETLRYIITTFSHHFLVMVLLTIAPSIAEGLHAWKNLAHPEQRTLQRCENDAALDDVAVGNPISHGQVIDLWTELREAGLKQYALEQLLKGSKVYVPPPAPKPEPVRRPYTLLDVFCLAN